MISEYFNMYLPICSLVISLLVVIIFFTKKNTLNIETKIYSLLIKVGLIESIATTFLTFFVHLYFNTKTEIYFAIANKILYIIYIIWISILFLYFSYLVYNKNKEQFKLLKYIVLIINLILSLMIIFAKIDLVYLTERNVSNSYGMAANILYVGCAFYIFLMILVSLINYRELQNKRKYIPLIILIVMMILALVIRAMDPYVNMTSNIISLISLIMYFTIENPDTKMVNKLNLAILDMEKSNKVKNDFLASMSHEVRTPLNAIRGFSELNLMSDNLEEIRENSKEVIKASDTLLNMVNNILEITNLEDKIEVVKEKYNVKELFLGVINLYKYKLEDKKLIMELKINTLPKYLGGDASKIRRILINLIDNAIKYTDKGKIIVKGTGKYVGKNYDLKIEVIDTGRGMDDELKSNLFKEFVREEELVNSSIPGLGLGLSLTKRLVEELNGEIEVESKLKEGTKFTVKLKQERIEEK